MKKLWIFILFYILEFVIKYVCVSFSGIGSLCVFYGGVMGFNWEFDLFGDSNFNLVFFEEFFGFGGYDFWVMWYGMILGFGGFVFNMFLGIFLLVVGVFFLFYIGVVVFGLLNIVVSFGGVLYIIG